MKPYKLVLTTLLIALSFFAFCKPSSANLLQNPGLETGDFTNWTVGGDQNFLISGATLMTKSPPPVYGVSSDGVLISDAYYSGQTMVHGGSYAAYAVVTATSGPAITLNLSQTMSVVPGTSYDISYWAGNGTEQQLGSNGYFSVNSSTYGVYGSSYGLPSHSWDFYGFTWTAPAETTSAAVTFILTGSGTASAVFSFDDFQFTQGSDFGPADSGPAVPVPATFWFFASGLISLGALRVRQGRKKS